MSGVVAGSPVSAANSNASWIAKNGDDTTVGRLGLSNALSVSGTAVPNPQRELNSEASFVGKALNSVKDDLPSYTNNNGFTNPESLMARIDALSLKMDKVAGHKHTAADGDAPNIPVASISGTLPATKGGTGQSAYVIGDILYASTTTALSKLPVGTTGYVLTVAAGLPSWQPAPGSGGTNHTILTKTANYTLLNTDDLIIANTQSSAFTLTLPAASAAVGREFFFKKPYGDFDLSFATTGGDTIDFDSSLIISGEQISFSLISDGTSNWMIF